MGLHRRPFVREVESVFGARVVLDDRIVDHRGGAIVFDDRRLIDVGDPDVMKVPDPEEIVVMHDDCVVDMVQMVDVDVKTVDIELADDEYVWPKKMAAEEWLEGS
jgi:hypothetical protein